NLSPIDARDAPAHRAEHLVGDSLRESCDIIYADHRFAGAAPQYHFVADRGVGNFGQIDHRQVHTNGTNDRRAAAAHQHFATVLQAAAITVRIADREHSDHTIARRDKRVSIADAAPGWHVLDLQH